ncbi:thiamine biosynthesis lipoprotein [Novosphingobium capsulatum]|uniref:FAD:protein FMN transferase n=1 Tax=Novosphingobium capsulatum TaxID=13688 RepID=A0ABU1MSH5_9SPHN|nr:FAD:protein FMN transferase [Novosphingobium capsulatum]MDR6513118.1 thiamine biosynthesis lipoprotein [Novosphingobium capsulatum]
MLRLAVPTAIAPDSLAGFDPAAPIITLSGLTMGTRWQVRLAHPAGSADRAALHALIQARLDRMERALSHWQPGSLLMRFNRAAPGTWLHVDEDLAGVLHHALAVARASHSAFDPAIGRLTDAWSLGSRRHSAPPDSATLAAASTASGWQRLILEHAWLRQPGGLWLDLSGVAKGYAADAVADLLAAQGLRHALVEVGGECTGRGLRPDGDPWWVDVESPPGANLAPLRMALHQLSTATSGSYLGLHTIDPATGQPGRGHGAATVLHRHGAMADAWASALIVMAPAQAHAVAVRENLATRLVDPSGGEWVSPALAAMME